jgi:hypothetical protein
MSCNANSDTGSEAERDGGVGTGRFRGGCRVILVFALAAQMTSSTLMLQTHDLSESQHLIRSGLVSHYRYRMLRTRAVRYV